MLFFMFKILKNKRQIRTNFLVIYENIFIIISKVIGMLILIFYYFLMALILFFLTNFLKFKKKDNLSFPIF